MSRLGGRRSRALMRPILIPENRSLSLVSHIRDGTTSNGSFSAVDEPKMVSMLGGVEAGPCVWGTCARATPRRHAVDGLFQIPIIASCTCAEL